MHTYSIHTIVNKCYGVANFVNVRRVSYSQIIWYYTALWKCWEVPYSIEVEMESLYYSTDMYRLRHHPLITNRNR